MVTLTFEPVPGWEQLPEGVRHRDATDVAVAPNNDVYVLTRNDPRVIVYDSSGRFLRIWGEDTLSPDPHGISVDAHGTVYVVDRGDHTVKTYSSQGTHLGTWGTGEPSDTSIDFDIQDPVERDRREPTFASGPPFNKPTKAAPTESGDVYVSDGYRNARIHKFDASGNLLHSWGGPGFGEGQFYLPHSVVVAPDDRLIVADRENSRLQFFTLDGKYLAAWDHVQRPAALAVDHNGRIFVGESFDGPPYPSRHFVGKDFVNGRVSVYEPNGTLLAFVEGAVDSLAPGRFISAHGIAVDSEGAIYTAENSWHTAHALNFTHRDDAAAPVQKWVPKCR